MNIFVKEQNKLVKLIIGILKAPISLSASTKFQEVPSQWSTRSFVYEMQNLYLFFDDQIQTARRDLEIFTLSRSFPHLFGGHSNVGKLHDACNHPMF